MKSEKDLIMMYHTQIRNIALYTSISLACLAYSRFYRDKAFFRNIGGILMSISIIFIALTINYYLYKDIEYFMKDINSDIMPKWIKLLPLIALVQFLILAMNFYTLYKQLS